MKRRGRIAAVNVSARHRVTIAPAIGRDRRRIALALPLAQVGEPLEALDDIPPVVLAAAHDGDFLHAILADIADPEIASRGIKAEAPRLAKTHRPDLWPRTRLPAKRIVRGNRVGEPAFAVIDIDAQHLAEEQPEVLRVAIGILLRAGVAHREVEKPVRPKGDAAAGVVLRHRRDRHDSPRRLARIGAQVRRGAELDERRHHLPRLHRLVFKVIFPVLAKLRMKCHAEQPVGPALRKHAGGKIAEQRLHKTLGGFFHPPNLAQLVGDQKHALAARHLSEPREPCADVSRLAHHRRRKT